MGYLPDWFMNYGNAPGSTPVVSPGPAMPPGSSPPRLPSWFMNYGNDPTKAQGASYNDVDNVPYNPATGPNNSSQAMRGAPVPPSIPPAMQASFPPQGGSVPLPPVHNGGNWATTAALEGDPAGQPDWAPQNPLPDWATPDAQKAMAAETRQIGPGSWFDPSKLSGMVGKNSLFGKLMALRNPSDAPQTEKHQGLLSGLFNDGAMFGRDPTTPNSTTGGLW